MPKFEAIWRKVIAMDVQGGMAWFEGTLAGNEVWRLLVWLAAMIGAAVVGKIARYYLKRISGALKSHGRLMEASLLNAISKPIVFTFVVIAMKTGMHVLVLSPAFATFAMTTTNVMLVVAIAFVLYCLVDVVSDAMRRAAEKTPSKLDDMLAPMVKSILRMTVVVLGLVQVATVLSDKPLTSIVAGLGVGGLAVALAAQETIKNFFGSVTVLTDKPFELGDRVMVDKYDGVVEHVGFRSTRLRTMEGDLVTIPNGTLAGMGIQNAGKRPYFRRVMKIGIAYGTAPAKVERAVEIIKEILANHPSQDLLLPPRVHFNEFGSSSLDITVMYWFCKTDYWEFMDYSQAVNIEVLRRLNAEGVSLAVPTQMVYMGGDRHCPDKATTSV